MAKRRPVDPFANGPNGERDPQGRFRRGGWKGGPGARLHRYVQQRRALQAAAMVEVSPKELQQLIRQLFQTAMDGDMKAAGLILSYAVGKAPEPLSPVQMGAPERITRMPVLSIEDIAEGLQRTYEEYQSGRLNEAEARMSRDILASLLEARRAGDLEHKLDELKLAMERNADGQPS